jgi:hypothetical protein
MNYQSSLIIRTPSTATQEAKSFFSQSLFASNKNVPIKTPITVDD